MKPLVVRPEAEADLTEACRWYEARAGGLGAQFLLSVDAAFASIERAPQQYAIVYRDIVRRALTRRFPYSVFFIVGERVVSIIGVIHTKRSPAAWQNRVHTPQDRHS